MRKFSFWSRAATVVASALVLSSCLKAPDYAVEPNIEFEDITLISYRGPSRFPFDSVRVKAKFQDGDGDLGLGGPLGVLPADTAYPFAYKNADKTLNRYNNNYFVQPYLKNRATGVFEKLPDSRATPGGYSGRYLRLTAADTKPAPLKGTITRSFSFGLGSPFFPGDEVRFEVSITDRALHESNTITTSSIIIPPR